jgi:hypothetical protein
VAELTKNKNHSCGCLAKEHLKDMANGNITHGMTGTRLYGCYKGMMSRCYRKKDIHYKAYGGRGIVVCDEWKNNAKAFIDWAITHGYSDDLTIERIDVNGNYEPSNCTWIPMSEQYKNKQSNYNKQPLPQAYKAESENSMTNEQISKIKKEYFVMDEYGFTDKELVDKVNELVNKVNELIALIQHKTESEE